MVQEARRRGTAASPARWWTLIWVAGTITTAAAAFAPWVRTGRVVRSGFALADSAHSLDVVAGRGHSIVLALWYLLPLLAAGCFTAAILDRRVVAAVGAVIAALTMVVVATLVLRSSLPTAWGPPLGLGAAAATLLAVAVDRPTTRDDS